VVAVFVLAAPALVVGVVAAAAVLIVGLFSIDVVTGRFLHHWRRAGVRSA